MEGALPPRGLWPTVAVVNAAAVLERCDEQALPAVYAFIGRSWGVSPTQLGAITLARALTQTLSSPLGGVAGHLGHRGRVLGAGCLMWGASTAAFAACSSLHAGVAVWAFNGVGLALVVPNTQSLTADLFPEGARGRAFGLLYLTGALGGMLGALWATNMGARTVLGLEGWRAAFLVLAAAAAAAGVANLVWTRDPAQEAAAAAAAAAAHAPARGGAGGSGNGGGGPGSPGGWDKAWVGGKGWAGEGEAGKASDRVSLGSGDSAAEWPSGGGGGSPGRGAARQQQEQQIERQRLLPPPPATAGGGARSSSPWQQQQPHDQQQQPRGVGWAGGGGGGARAVLRGLGRDVGSVLRIPTFCVIVLQGIAGSIPWSALVFLTLYLQLLGMSNAAASSLVALFLAGTAFGGLIGGAVGDAAARCWPRHGRLAVTQVAVGAGIPYALLLMKGLPRDGRPATIALYAATLLSFALIKPWPAPAFNNPCFAEIVPPRQRTLIYAFDRCFEGAVAACAAPLVGLLAQRVFGFSGHATVTHDRATDLANAEALGSALLAFMVVPWALCLVMYTGLHWTYPRDRAAAAERMQAELLAAAAAAEGLGAGGDEEEALPVELDPPLVPGPRSSSSSGGRAGNAARPDSSNGVELRRA